MSVRPIMGDPELVRDEPLPQADWQIRAEALRLAREECEGGFLHRQDMLERARIIYAFLMGQS